jgi:hypothetical protein
MADWKVWHPESVMSKSGRFWSVQSFQNKIGSPVIVRIGSYRAVIPADEAEKFSAAIDEIVYMQGR